jgi:hypothetical protein
MCTIHENPGLGMEIELLVDGNSNPFMTKPSGVAEEKIKAKPIYSIANNRVNVTFDTRTGYDENVSSGLVIELVFDHKKVPLFNTNFKELGEQIVTDVSNMKFSDLRNKQRFVEDNVVINGYNNDLIFPKNAIKSLNIHITLAMSLKDIYQLKQDYRSELSKMLGIIEYVDNSIIDTNIIDTEAKVFIEVLKGMFDAGIPVNDKHDPKQKMKIMNRTSFGKIFSLLETKGQEDVIRWMNYYRKDWSLTKNHPVTYDDMLIFLESVKKDQKNSINDPIYRANHGDKAEKIGIGHLGDEMGKNQKGISCPIFEFRVGGNNWSFDNIPDKLKILGEAIKYF